MSQQAPLEGRQAAEQEVFALMKEASSCLMAGDVDRFNDLQVQISTIQKQHGAMAGIERIQHARTA